MSVFSTLSVKPWTKAQGVIDDRHEGYSYAMPKASLGLRIFLAVVTVLFMLMIISYGDRMAAEDWRPAPEISLLWLNTALLILGSAALQMALIGSETDRPDWLYGGVIAGFALTLGFLAGQIFAWQQLTELPTFSITNPAIAFFYMITVAHALHMAGGVFVLARTGARLWREGDSKAMRLSLGRCTLYWHYLLIVWLVLFGLLFSGNDNLGFLLAICGIR